MSPNPPAKARAYFIDTDFHKTARLPGGVTRAEAIDNAQQNLDAITEDFEAALNDKMRDLLALVAPLGDNPVPPDLFGKLCADVRELRDSGTTMGYPLVTFVADNLCKILDLVGGNITLPTVACHIDAMRLSTLPQYRKASLQNLPELINGLNLVAVAAKSRQAQDREA